MLVYTKHDEFLFGDIIENQDGYIRIYLGKYKPKYAGEQVIYESIVPRIKNKYISDIEEELLNLNISNDIKLNKYMHCCNTESFFKWARKSNIVGNAKK